MLLLQEKSSKKVSGDLLKSEHLYYISYIDIILKITVFYDFRKSFSPCRSLIFGRPLKVSKENLKWTGEILNIRV